MNTRSKRKKNCTLQSAKLNNFCCPFENGLGTWNSGSSKALCSRTRFFSIFSLVFIEVACLVLVLACFEIFLPTHQLLPIGIFNYYSKNSCFNWKSKFKFCTALIYVKNQPKSYFRQFCWVVFNFQTQFVV